MPPTTRSRKSAQTADNEAPNPKRQRTGFGMSQESCESTTRDWRLSMTSFSVSFYTVAATLTLADTIYTCCY
ncbi:hypothetical protein BDQ12DRAFT_674407 [Crucibulum laeve]|uniref:Uncharacterized protein n=1 Tax=Crucibulum laeve TaxID=68775 RepID=A0A5C3MFA2_9AGAR|nr:hypothetical protein BDQ12DRAFT_674407 [Crucibulum laeve]